VTSAVLDAENGRLLCATYLELVMRRLLAVDHEDKALHAVTTLFVLVFSF
tara:strand:+ start:990 stop:1139 length:150 start_codon:yes stop_codon:yes gene_type:complete